VTSVAVAILVAGCLAGPPTSPSDGSPSSPSAPPPAASADGSAGASPLGPAALDFPEPRELTVEPPVNPTPDGVIDAFHRLVHDPDLTYRAEGTSRWVIDGDERLGTNIISRAGDRLHVVVGASTGVRGEAIVAGGSAAAREAAGEWQAADAASVRLFDGLATALVIADLGAEPAGAGYRLLLEGGFDSTPRGLTSVGVMEKVTEIVVDEAGTPLSVTFHQWLPSVPAGGEAPEGVAVFTFADVGSPVTIPPLPIAPAGEPSAAPTAAPTVTTMLPGGMSVELPGPAQEGSSELTFWGPGEGAIEVASVVVASGDGARFEAGTAVVPPDGLAHEERMSAVRIAITGRLPGGDVLGHRHVSIGGVPGQEFVADGYDDELRSILHRMRTVIIGDRLVILSVAGPRTVVGSPRADQFLWSFEAPAQP